TNPRRLVKISVNLGDIYFKAGMAHEAAGAYFNAIGYGAEDAGLHNKLGIAYAESGNLYGASAEFKRALTLDPAHDAALRNLGRITELLRRQR
ncbi:MAG: tetratricopeptide repeat protein, partial [bacterium]|nr:tetratricopeptide repeat protein [bacterium]